MERKPYSAGAVKFSFWFMEFRKTVQLLSEGKSFADIKKLNEETNIYGAPTKLRAQQIYSTVTARIKTLDESFYPIFLSSDLATQKLFVLTAALLHDTLFFDFAVLGEISISGTILKVDELANSLQVCLDSGAKKVLLPITSAADLGTVPPELVGSFNLIFYSSAEDAVFKALGVE